MRVFDEQPQPVPWMANVVEINDLDELEQYRLTWNALLPQTPRVSIFHTLDWLQTYWHFFGREQELRVLVILSDAKPIGIVPLCIRTERYQLGQVRVLTYPLSDWGMWYGPIGPNTSASLFMAIKHLQQTPRTWDMIDLRWIDTDLNLNDLASSLLPATSWRGNQSVYQQTSIIDLEGSDWETYHANLSKKWRHELNRQKRALLRDHRVEFERHRPLGFRYDESEPRWDLYENCLAIAAQSWQGESTTGNTLSHAEVRDFLHQSHAVAAKLGMLDMIVLKVDKQPAAFQYNYCYDGNLYGLRMGFDRKFARHGVGKVLMGWTIQDSFDRGDRLLDLGIGDYSFKQRFRTRTEISSRYMVYSWQAWRGQGVRLSRWIKSHWPKRQLIGKK